jgi:hypothetical protein
MLGKPCLQAGLTCILTFACRSGAKLFAAFRGYLFSEAGEEEQMKQALLTELAAINEALGSVQVTRFGCVSSFAPPTAPACMDRKSQLGALQEHREG